MTLHIDWAELFFFALASAGVTDVVLSPGSRSTPLAVAAASHPALRVHVVVDERSAAFFALGQARVTARPSVLVCTSGTAGAHYLPAIIEAAHSRVPMIAVTADRPWEDHDCGASQTIDQEKLFGGFVRHFADLGLPDVTGARAVPRIAAQAVARSLGPTPGPVHINSHFRKPLDPVPGAARDPAIAVLLARPVPAVHAPVQSPDPGAIAEIARRIQRAERGLIACGPAPLAQAEGRDAILELARRTGFALFAEATSQIRFGGDRAGVVELPAIDRDLAPDLVLELGAPPTSAAYAEIAAPRFVITPHGYTDPRGDALGIVEAHPVEVARALVSRLVSSEETVPRTDWAAAAQAVSGPWITSQVGPSRDREDARDTALDGPAIARALLAACPDGALLAVGNSTPVRDLDRCPPSSRDVRVLHQRGAAGIDGLLSGACGARSATQAPVALLLGDLSLFHDLGALSLAARAEGPLVIVVVQNGGGRIFERLPIARAVAREALERCFVTPVDVRFEQAALAFGVAFARAHTRPALDDALAHAFARPGATLVEAVVRTSPKELAS